MGVLAALAAEVAQIVLLLLAAPLWVDVMQAVGAWMGGERAAPFGTRWREIIAGWRRGDAVGFFAWATLVPAMAATAILPLGTVHTLLACLADPLAIGLMLLATRLPLWVRVPSDVVLRRNILARLAVSREWQTTLMLVPLLALTSALLAIGLPGVDGLAGLVRDMRAQPVSALTGALVFAALGILLVVQGRLLSAEEFDTLAPSAEGRERAVLRYGHDVASGCWLLLMADLAMPGLMGNGARLSMTMTGWAVAPLRLAAVAALVAVVRGLAPRAPSRHAAIFAGAAVLLVLAGRLSA
ncbi:hypothetical protein NCH01_02660 [Neoasaia chiangmaiensis]|uniref:Uncharacterized protein n=2 Tax=Neoasaia chiangmaiensis TaxID=320497 RepID=A0A1U9KT17_9PROT|nr:hypothetical protein A0U93_14040 [Neoasaia chiangmaiensis]GEN13835.1 hypothetical protein NCH01_02660 [Neoasaia chiangmaiensis]